jgi:hypothetical protein
LPEVLDRGAQRPAIHAAILKIAPSANGESLAVLRIAAAVVGLRLLAAVIDHRYSQLPQELWVPPTGTGWMVGIIPVNSSTVELVGVAAAIGLVLVLIGWRHRIGGMVSLVGLFYLGWIPQLTGKVDHYHHVLWFLLLVVAFPSSDRFSLADYLRRRSGGGQVVRPSHRYAVPVLAGTILIGFIHLFPGLAKLATSGFEWAFSDNLRNIMYRKWFEDGVIPFVRIDGFPAVYQIAALGAILFEISFLPLSLWRRTRPYMVGIGLAFHTATGVMLGISFVSLMIFLCRVGRLGESAAALGRSRDTGG